MGLNLNMKVMNQVIKGVDIYEEGEPVESVCLVLKGRLLVHRKGMQTILGSGNFLGISDLYSGRHSVSYTAFDNAVVYPFPIRGAEDIADIIKTNKEYGGLMVASLSRYIKGLYSILNAEAAETEQLYTFLKSYYDVYLSEAKKTKIQIRPLRRIEELKAPEDSSVLDLRKADYYSECAGIPVEAQKAFYQNDTVCLYHIEEQTELARQLILECSEKAGYLENTVEHLFSDGEDCLFKRACRLIIDENRCDVKPSMEIMDSIDLIVEKINSIDTILEESTGNPLCINRDELENLYYIIISGETPAIETGAGNKEKTASLKGALDTILETGKIEAEIREEFRGLLEEYKNQKDRLATDNSSRKLRKDISALFYKIYREVFIQVYNKKECPLCVNLFLNYGFLDETFLREEQLMELAELEDINEENGPCKVYNMKQWLTLIYTGKRLPSKSEFDLDYEEYIRSLRKTNEITEEEGNRRLRDLTERLDYEIQNMFQCNNRLMSGQITTFVPFLREENFITGMKKALVTSDALNNVIKDIRKIDYAAFFREILYENAELEIKREYIIKEVFPEIILLPVYGENAVMWQELSGRKRDSKGRFLFPIFTVKDLQEMLVKVMGRYHWELCRTIQGSAWNNIKYKSLTSEYMDYLQFYRRNRELSEEKKEKLKAQIQKSRNNSREVFVMDYGVWILNEANGAIRLNKVVREMMATYCPFASEIRESIKNQPIFAEAMNRFNVGITARIRALEIRIKTLEKEGKDIPEEFTQTLRYYKE